MTGRGGTRVGRTRTASRRGRAVPAWVPGAGLAALLALLFVPPAAAEPVQPGYASVKIASPARTDRASVRLALPAGEWPRRGMLVATGNILSPLARWIVLDLDRRTIRRAATRLTDGGGSELADRGRTDPLSDRELRTVIEAANGVWRTRDPDPPVLGEVTDALCNVTLFDGDDVLHEVDSACPRHGFVAVLEAVAASAGHRRTRPEPSPDAR